MNLFPEHLLPEHEPHSGTRESFRNRGDRSRIVAQIRSVGCVFRNEVHVPDRGHNVKRNTILYQYKQYQAKYNLILYNITYYI